MCDKYEAVRDGMSVSIYH